MRKTLITPILAVGLILTACATTRTARLGAELPGSTMRIEMPGGMAMRLGFNADGNVTGTSATGQQAVGRWTIEGQQICLEFPRQGKDCYPYTRPFQRGETVSLTGTSGATVRATLE